MEDLPAGEFWPEEPGEHAPMASAGADEVSFAFTEQMIMATRPDSVWAEAIRALRSGLLSKHVKLGRRALAVCAPAGSTGCSFVAANLALAMAQAGVNTLLIDGNLREPSVGDYLRTSGPVMGLADCLRDESMSLGKAICPVQPNLSVLFAGSTDQASFDQLGSPAFRSLVGQCLRDFELTIIDTPPSNQFADSRRIAAVVRYAMVVTRRNETFIKDVEALLDELGADGVNVIGTYLNDF